MIQNRNAPITLRTAEHTFTFAGEIGAVLSASHSQKSTVVLPASVVEVSLTRIGSDAFSGHSLQEFFASAPLREIGESAFRDCPNLRTVLLPSTLERIGARAFTGCVSLTRIDLPSSLTTIGEGAFDGCHPDLVFGVVDGSPAHTWADSLGLPTWILPRPAITPSEPAPLATTPPDTSRFKIDDDGTYTSPRATLADSIRLTPRMVCHLLEVPLPLAFEAHADIPHPSLTASLLTTKPGSLYFGSLRSKNPETLSKILARGASAFVTNRQLLAPDGTQLPCIIVSDPVAAFKHITTWISQQFGAKRIALTGSVGKTTTKEMVRSVVETQFRTLYSRSNHNGLGQIGRYVQRLDDTTEVYIQEIGAARPGSISGGAPIVQPHAFIMTNIGLNHVGNYGGSQKALLDDKMSLDQFLPTDGVAFVCVDDPLLRDYPLTHKRITYGMSNPDVDYTAKNIVEREGKLTFDVLNRENGQSTAVTIHAFGQHNVLNALAAFAVGRWLDIPVASIARGLAAYRGEGLRQNLVTLGGRKVLVDCYNASEVSAKSVSDALNTISPGPGGRRFLVFADIDDKLGDATEEVHRRVGRQFAAESGIEKFYCFGAHAAWAAEEARAGGAQVFATTDRAALHEALRAELRPTDVVAFKGGQQMALSITIDTLFGSAFSILDGDELTKRATDSTVDGVNYRNIREYGTFLRKVPPSFTAEHLSVAPAVAGNPVYMIGPRAAVRSSITSVHIPAPVRTIAEGAFSLCRNLQEISLPATLRVIESRAFSNCSALAEIDLPDGLTTIGSRAFFRCTALERIYLPSSVKTIEEQAFAYAANLTIEVDAGSYAEQFCRKNWPKRPLVVRSTNGSKQPPSVTQRVRRRLGGIKRRLLAVLTGKRPR